MNSVAANMLHKLADQFVGFIPNLVAAIVLIILGWVVGWLLKRLFIQVCLTFGVHRYLPRRRWSEAFSKADVRDAVYNFAGNIVFVIVFLIFLYSALVSLKLTVLSHILQTGFFFLPRLIGCLVIFGVGYFLADRIGSATQAGMLRESLPRGILIGRLVRAATLLFFGAMALYVLHIANAIVLIGFTVALTTIAVVAIVTAALGGKEVLARIFQPPEDK